MKTTKELNDSIMERAIDLLSLLYSDFINATCIDETDTFYEMLFACAVTCADMLHEDPYKLMELAGDKYFLNKAKA